MKISIIIILIMDPLIGANIILRLEKPKEVITSTITQGTYNPLCGTYNYVEAPFCSGCGIAYPNGLPRNLIDQRSRGGFVRQGGMGRFRHGKWGRN